LFSLLAATTPPTQDKAAITLKHVLCKSLQNGDDILGRRSDVLQQIVVPACSSVAKSISIYCRISTMPLLTPSGKSFSLHKLIAMSTMLTPSHGVHLQQLNADTSEAPARPLYLSHTIQEYFRQVFDELRGSDSSLRRDRFQIWLADVQGHIVQLEKESYKFEQFLEAIYYNYALEIAKPIKALDLSKPITNYFISSSHNTYLMGNQLSSKSSTEAYKTVSILPCYSFLVLIIDRLFSKIADVLKSTYTMESRLRRPILYRRTKAITNDMLRAVLCPAELRQR
jgi:hypothetical protein